LEKVLDKKGELSLEEKYAIHTSKRAAFTWSRKCKKEIQLLSNFICDLESSWLENLIDDIKIFKDLIDPDQRKPLDSENSRDLIALYQCRRLAEDLEFKIKSFYLFPSQKKQFT
jgi:hypothetical protein